MFNFDDKKFRQRWYDAPPVVRQVFHNDLARIEQLLDLDTDFEQWQRHEEKASKQSQLLIEQTYLDTIQQLKLKKQNLLQVVLEKKLAQKRAEQIAQTQKLQQEELQHNLEQTQMLQQLGIQIQQESHEYVDRYNRTPIILTCDGDEAAQIESLRLRLELEAEQVIQDMVQQYRQQLRQIAQDEIAYLLNISEYNNEQTQEITSVSNDEATTYIEDSVEQNN